ncbi:hypothetical protein SAMN05421823_10178 [Catalinimonas alkaloidigena]|uniref:Lysylphosphatidylglycerol synthase TM region n=1 Tax=Catalinimonas alkaloidigena TaxID=1075417 RepID=A0A1G8WGL2_9BACT|nr:hypothetical protein [Catalinimonas alkaloidigena]SDJ77361.1 hypothetical protein SAMN05421823_10178 [Catalinimonas alkaloidigena]
MLQRYKISKPVKVLQRWFPVVWCIGLLGGLAYRLATQPMEAAWQLAPQPRFWVPALAMVPLNWGLEALKWQRLVRRIESLDWRTALRSVLSGLAADVASLPGLGDYLGRTVQLGSKQRFYAVVPLMLGNVLQASVAVLAGSVGAAMLVARAGWQLPAVAVSPVTLLLGSLAVLGTALAAGYALQRLSAPVREALVQLTRWSRTELAEISLLALARYAVFSLQFVLMLLAFGVMPHATLPGAAEAPISFATVGILLGGVAFYFLVKTLLPFLSWWGGLGLREATTAFFFSYWGIEAAPVVAAGIGLWCINVAFPALLGAGLSWRARWSTAR